MLHSGGIRFKNPSRISNCHSRISNCPGSGHTKWGQKRRKG